MHSFQELHSSLQLEDVLRLTKEASTLFQLKLQERYRLENVKKLFDCHRNLTLLINKYAVIHNEFVRDPASHELLLFRIHVAALEIYLREVTLHLTAAIPPTIMQNNCVMLTPDSKKRVNIKSSDYTTTLENELKDLYDRIASMMTQVTIKYSISFTYSEEYLTLVTAIQKFFTMQPKGLILHSSEVKLGAILTVYNIFNHCAQLQNNPKDEVALSNTISLYKSAKIFYNKSQQYSRIYQIGLTMAISRISLIRDEHNIFLHEATIVSFTEDTFKFMMHYINDLRINPKGSLKLELEILLANIKMFKLVVGKDNISSQQRHYISSVLKETIKFLIQDRVQQLKDYQLDHELYGIIELDVEIFLLLQTLIKNNKLCISLSCLNALEQMAANKNFHLVRLLVANYYLEANQLDIAVKYLDSKEVSMLPNCVPMYQTLKGDLPNEKEDPANEVARIEQRLQLKLVNIARTIVKNILSNINDDSWMTDDNRKLALMRVIALILHLEDKNYLKSCEENIDNPNWKPHLNPGYSIYKFIYASVMEKCSKEKKILRELIADSNTLLEVFYKLLDSNHDVESFEKFNTHYNKLLSVITFSIQEKIKILSWLIDMDDTNHTAQLNLAKIYLNNNDLENGKLLLQASAKDNNPHAQYELAQLELKDNNLVLALTLLEQSSQHIVQAKMLLIKLYIKQLETMEMNEGNKEQIKLLYKKTKQLFNQLNSEEINTELDGLEKQLSNIKEKIAIYFQQSQQAKSLAQKNSLNKKTVDVIPIAIFIEPKNKKKKKKKTEQHENKTMDTPFPQTTSLAPIVDSVISCSTNIHATELIDKHDQTISLLSFSHIDISKVLMVKNYLLSIKQLVSLPQVNFEEVNNSLSIITKFFAKNVDQQNHLLKFYHLNIMSILDGLLIDNQLPIDLQLNMLQLIATLRMATNKVYGMAYKLINDINNRFDQLSNYQYIKLLNIFSSLYLPAKHSASIMIINLMKQTIIRLTDQNDKLSFRQKNSLLFSLGTWLNVQEDKTALVEMNKRIQFFVENFCLNVSKKMTTFNESPLVLPLVRKTYMALVLIQPCYECKINEIQLPELIRKLESIIKELYEKEDPDSQTIYSFLQRELSFAIRKHILFDLDLSEIQKATLRIEEERLIKSIPVDIFCKIHRPDSTEGEVIFQSDGPSHFIFAQDDSGNFIPEDRTNADKARDFVITNSKNSLTKVIHFAYDKWREKGIDYIREQIPKELFIPSPCKHGSKGS